MVADSTDPAVLMDFANVLKIPADYIVRHSRADKTSPLQQWHEPTLGSELVRVENVSFEYLGGIKALANVSLSVREGERIALLGNNGAGKSTLALSMMGILKPTSGRVLVMGEDTTNLTTSEIARLVSLVFQSPFSMLFAKTVREELAFGPKNIGLPSEQISATIPETAKHCSIQHLLDQSPYASSYGEKKRICVGSVLTMEPKCVILDEPTAGQDYQSYSNFMKFIESLREHVKAFIVITHDPDLAIEHTDRAVVLSGGQIIADGPTRRVLADPTILSKGAIRETSQIELSRKLTSGQEVLSVAELLQASTSGSLY
jgi:energy-coupling factor transport system ATP-binding protein